MSYIEYHGHPGYWETTAGGAGYFNLSGRRVFEQVMLSDPGLTQRQVTVIRRRAACFEHLQVALSDAEAQFTGKEPVLQAAAADGDAAAGW